MRDADMIGLEARLDAQRQMLRWMLQRLTDEDARHLLDCLGGPFPPQDHQEDPGAVPTDALAAMMAFQREADALLKPLRERLSG